MAGEVFIYVMERGFVRVAVPAAESGDALFLGLARSAIVRKWGTTGGLGQLAREGPTPDTVLDREPDGVEINRRAVYARIPCDPEAWRRWTERTA